MKIRYHVVCFLGEIWAVQAELISITAVPAAFREMRKKVEPVIFGHKGFGVVPAVTFRCYCICETSAGVHGYEVMDIYSKAGVTR